MDNGHLPVFVEAFETGHSRIEPEVVVDLAKPVCGETDVGSMVVVSVVTVRNDCIQAVVATGEFIHDENPTFVSRLCGNGSSGMRKQRGHSERARCACTNPKKSSTQQIAARHLRETLHTHKCSYRAKL